MSESCNDQALDLVLVGAISKDENIYTDRSDAFSPENLPTLSSKIIHAAALVSLKLESPGPFRETMEDVQMKMKAQSA